MGLAAVFYTTLAVTVCCGLALIWTSYLSFKKWWDQ